MSQNRITHLLQKRIVNIPQIVTNNVHIKQVESHKHLITTLQRNANWTIHIQEMVTKAKKKVDIMRGLTYKLNCKSLERLYTCYICPVLEYANTVWDRCTDYNR